VLSVSNHGLVLLEQLVSNLITADSYIVVVKVIASLATSGGALYPSLLPRGTRGTAVRVYGKLVLSMFACFSKGHHVGGSAAATGGPSSAGKTAEVCLRVHGTPHVVFPVELRIGS
jgi:hypothetical protein